MSSKKKQAELREEKEWESVDKAVMRSGNFLEQYSKQLMIAVGVFVVIGCGYLAYQRFYIQPRNEEAQNASFRGQDYVAQRQDSVALYGDGNGFVGFEKIADEYGSTPAGNLARAYAGICYSNLGNYDKALTFLKDYSHEDKIFSNVVYGTIGDCLDNQGKLDEALSYYEKAAKGADDAIYSPVYYKKAAQIYMQQKKYDKVVEIFEMVKNKYANSQIARIDADKYIIEANALQGVK